MKIFQKKHVSLLIIFILIFEFQKAFAQTTTKTMLLNVANEVVEIKDLQELQKEDALKIASKTTTTKAIILTYHSVRNFDQNDSIFAENFITSIPVFEQEMKYLKDNNFNVISPEDLLNLIQSNATSSQKNVIITFDDGYLNNYIYAVPILEKNNFHATFFIYSNAISKFKIAMTWKNLKDLVANGNSIGGHTKSHPKLDRLKIVQKMEDEIAGNKKILEEKLNTKVNFFAYPYGLRSALAIQKVKEAGYLGAMTDIHGTLHTKKSTYELNRFNMNSDYAAFLEFVNLK